VVNWLHSRFHDPNNGWDPITPQYAEGYGHGAVADRSLVERFAQVVGGLAGKSVADVGSGPGHYSMEFARRGAVVTCVDVSRTYLAMVEEKMRAQGLTARCALGYMDSINRITAGNFDAIFSNVAWNYCMNDWAFARQLLRAVRPGGAILIRETTDTYFPISGLYSHAMYWLNGAVGWKIGHPHPPRGRIAAAFARLGGCEIVTDYSEQSVDIVAVKRH
jgi:2-polyprenyl-3-methyl-5-hydroxy-6-metoxy-1,4-benzoquinol methylase